jgi:small nuclear ribonucleoprotein (snRNP)-like protein
LNQPRKNGLPNSQMSTEKDQLLKYRDHYVVVDTTSPYIYIGKLVDVTENMLTLSDADVHDSRESTTMNEKYIMETKKYGVRSNRHLVHIRFNMIISLSRLDDVVEY